MAKAILGKKIGMTQIFNEEGKIVPVTVIEAGPCLISQIKTIANDGYEAIQIGFGDVRPVALNKPQSGHFKKNGLLPRRFLREIRLESTADYQIGQELKADLFAPGDKVDISGISKGKGFAGTIKRWNDHRGPMSHGSKSHRRPASAGAKGPARVFKGKHAPGQMGGERVTVQNLQVVKTDGERNLLLVRGAVPGPKQGLLFIKASIKK